MVDLEGQDVVAVLTRAPSAGGKTRLFRELGRTPDPELLAALLLDTLDAVALPGFRRAVCFTPVAAESEMRTLVAPDVLVIAQRGDDLGDSMRYAFDDLFALGAASVTLIGSDVPGISPATITSAHRILRSTPDAVVLGPAADGGYYLVAATRTPALLFSGMAWSRPDVLEETERRAREGDMDVVRVAVTRDVDTIEDLRALIGSHADAVRTRIAWRRYQSGHG
jgi:rSAM/selenodomain-associated transferase 1